jgi:small-conductance mechanosensitive channel
MKKFLQSLHSSLPQWMADWLDVLVPAVEVALIVICAMTLMRVIKMYLNRLVRAYALPVKSALLIQRMIGFIVYGGAMLWSLERIGVSGTVLWSAFTGFAAVGAVAFFAAWSVLSNLSTPRKHSVLVMSLK